MSLITLNNNNFETMVSSDNIVLVDCWAKWCDECRTFAPVYERVSNGHPTHIFGKLDMQSQKDLVATLGIENVPSLLLFRDGILLYKHRGTVSEEQMENIVRQAESMDMEKVRVEVETETRNISERAN